MPHGHDHDDRPLLERTDDVYTRNDLEVRREVVHDRFGGIDVPATLVGALVAMALTAILGGALGAFFGTTVFGDGTSLRSDEMLTAAVAGGVVLCLSYFVGGWAAGRIARYNGTRNGFVATLWTLVFGVAAGAAATYFGERYDLLSSVGMPNWLAGEDVVSGGIIGAIAAMALMFLFACLGGKRGELYHDRADSVLIELRAHGI